MGSVVFLLAATLATGAAYSAPQVEREDPPAAAAAPAPEAPAKAPAPPAAAVPPKPPVSESERDERLAEAKRRLEAAAAEVAALSSEIAAQAMQGIGNAFIVGARRSIIGVQLETVPGGAGAKVTHVSPGGAAEAAGLRAGDLIVGVNGNEVKGGAREVVGLMRVIEPDTTFKVRVMRDGKPRDFNVTARRFDPRTFAWQGPDVDFDFNFDGPFSSNNGWGGGVAGMEITALTPQLARYFNTDKGLLVVRAPKDDVFKLQDGDVILNIDGRVPASGSHVTRILRSYQPGEQLTMRIMRDRKPIDLQITLPEQNRGRGRTRAARTVGDATEI